MTKVVLIANDSPGVETAKYLLSQGDEIVRLYLHSKNNQKHGQEIIKASGCDTSRIFYAKGLKEPSHIKGLREIKADYIIAVYWAHLLGKDVIDCAREGTVNFHPALLPINRGWHPHVHSILDGSHLGVTLHEIDVEADSGPIWAQREIFLSEFDTAFTIYNRLQSEIVKLFKETWPKIKAKKIRPFPQDTSRAIYHKKSEIEQLDKINPHSVMKVEDLIKILRARSFGDKGFAYYEKNGQRVYLNIRLSKNTSFKSDE
jgi:methionyl-tRNA formyltransferase